LKFFAIFQRYYAHIRFCHSQRLLGLGQSGTDLIGFFGQKIIEYPNCTVNFGVLGEVQFKQLVQNRLNQIRIGVLEYYMNHVALFWNFHLQTLTNQSAAISFF
jgi:hypothetical protein